MLSLLINRSAMVCVLLLLILMVCLVPLAWGTALLWVGCPVSMLCSCMSCVCTSLIEGRCCGSGLRQLHSSGSRCCLSSASLKPGSS